MLFLKMFKFNFDSSNKSEIPPRTETHQELIDSEQVLNWIEANEVFFEESPDNKQYLNDNNSTVLSTTIGNARIKYLSSIETINSLSECDNLVLKTEQVHSDLIPAIYEGGLKIWNGTFDILEFLNKNNVTFSNMNALDLGCGNGLIGIYALLNGAGRVVFQDYNDEVIKYITIPNIRLNTAHAREKCQFFSGDWNSFAEKLPKNYFDFILTADTIYNCDNYEKLHAVFENLLKRCGKIYLAAKTVYFGLSGEIRKFEDLIKEKDVFVSKNVFSIMDGIQREILEIKYK